MNKKNPQTRVQFDRERVLRAYEYWGGPARPERIAHLVKVHTGRVVAFVEQAVERGVLVRTKKGMYLWPGTVKVQLVLDALHEEAWAPPTITVPSSRDPKKWAYIDDLNSERRIRENLGWVIACDYCSEPIPTGKEFVHDGTTRICFRHWKQEDVTTIRDPDRQIHPDTLFRLKSGGDATCFFCEEPIRKGVDFYLPWNQVGKLKVPIPDNIRGKKVCYSCGQALLEGAMASTS